MTEIVESIVIPQRAPSSPVKSISPLLAPSFTEEPLSVPHGQLAIRSLPRLRRDVGLKSSLPSGWGLEDIGMPYRKFDRTELLQVAGLGEATAWADVFPGAWLLCDTMAVEGPLLTSALNLASRGDSSACLCKEARRRNLNRLLCITAYRCKSSVVSNSWTIFGEDVWAPCFSSRASSGASCEQITN